MKGIVINLLEQVVLRDYGENTFLLEAAGLVGAYSLAGQIPGRAPRNAGPATSEALSVPGQDVIRWLGREALPALAQAYPAFFAPHADTRGPSS